MIKWISSRPAWLRRLALTLATLVAAVFVAATSTAVLYAQTAPTPPPNFGGAAYQKVCINDWTGEARWRLNPTSGCEALNDPVTGKDKHTGVGRWVTDWIVKRDGMGCVEGTRPETHSEGQRTEYSCLAPQATETQPNAGVGG